MSRIKRQDHGYHKSSPWSTETWAQYPPTYFETRPEDVRRLRIKKWEKRRPQRQRYTWNPYKYQRTSSPKIARPERVSFRPHRPGYLEHVYLVPYDSDPPEESMSDQDMPEEQEESINLDIDEDALQAADFTLTQPKQKDDAPSVVNDSLSELDEKKSIDEEQGLSWDEEGEREYRKLLRSLPESHDEEGYKVPIDGTISPETQAWNREHARNLLKQAAHEQQTPSRLPRHIKSPSPSTSSAVSSENESHTFSPKRSSTDPSSPSVISKDGSADIKPGDHGQEPLSPPQTVTKAETPVTKSINTTDIKQSQTPPTALPLPEIQNLSLKTPRTTRTPKSERFQTAKIERITRTQQRRAEIEAAKNAYPLVPLSKAWDDKVRYAVNHGHGRFEATMFNKCVPEYSNDPSARSLWLDDAVINDYVAMVAKHGSKSDRKDQVRSVSALSSFFFTKISSPNPNYGSCAGMLKRAGIPGKKLLDCEKVFIPINKTYHWTLAVIEPKIPEGLTAIEHKRRLTIYNSMGSSGGRQVAAIIMNWIQHDLGASFKDDEWEVDPAGESPQQRNTDDCGVFTCTTARQIMLGKYDDVNDRYKESDIKEMRKRIVAELVNGDLLNKDQSAS